MTSIDLDQLKEFEKKFNENADTITKEFVEYLGRVRDWYQKIKEKEEEKYQTHIWLIKETFFFISFILDKKIILKNYFSDDTTKVIHGVVSEIAQIILGIQWSLQNGSIIGAFSLCRTLLERIIIIKILFERKDEIEARINIYKDFEIIEKYKYAEKVKETDMMKEFKVDYLRLQEKYQFKGQTNLHKWYQPIQNCKDKSITRLIKDYLPDYLTQEETYSMFSVVTHGWAMNNNLLHYNNWLLPNFGYEGTNFPRLIAWFCIMTIDEVFSSITKYTDYDYSMINDFLKRTGFNMSKGRKDE